MKHTAICVLLIFGLSAYCKPKPQRIVGRYADFLTVLELKADSTFILSEQDPVYPFNYHQYENRGRWIVRNGAVVLNGDKEKRYPDIALVERTIAESDSLRIKVNYETRYFEHDTFIKVERTELPVITVYVNRRKDYHNLVHRKIVHLCAFGPPLRKQYVVDSSNILVLKQQEVATIGIRTYGFERTIELRPHNPADNYFEVSIRQPVDVERTPRNKTVVIRGDKAFFYERAGCVQTGMFANPLKRMTAKAPAIR